MARANRFCAWIALACLVVGAAHAQTPRYVADGYEDNLKKAQTISALGPDLFGEQVNLQDGSTSFSVTDVSIPTSSGLPVAVGRRLGINARDYDKNGTALTPNELMGNWSLDVPMIHGVYDQATGWVSTMPNPAQRCSVTTQAQMQPPIRASLYANGFNNYYPEQYWSGNQINIPGSGEEKLLFLPAERSRPSDGRTYYATTKSNWRVSCLPSILNGSGEGFLVVLPNGTKYYFNWMSWRQFSPLIDRLCVTSGGLGSACTDGTGMYRREYYLHATRVEDRFGNWVNYSYDPNNPRRLVSITSNEGAAISLSYVDGKVSAITANGRTWQYQYADAAKTTLAAVVQPDGSRWAFAYNNLLQVSSSNTKLLWTDCEALPTDQDAAPPLDAYISITHPSGTTGTFKFRRMNHGTNNTPGGCYDPNPDKHGDEELSSTVAAWTVPSLYQKVVTGPGFSTQTWSYRYEVSWSFTGGYVQPDCNVYGCNGRSATNVTGPDGTVNRYVFGNDYWLNAGQLLEQHVMRNGGVLKSIISTYSTASGQPFPDSVGYNPNIRDNPLTVQKLRPLSQSAITQDGVTFSNLVNSFDAFARPLSVTKSNTLGYSRTNVTEYYDHLGLWVLGQKLRDYTVVNGTALPSSSTDYDATKALPIRQYSYGKLQQTLTYNADGTVATARDGNNNTTTLSSWKRGIPQSIQYADGTTQSAQVDDNGWIRSVTDENGYVTGYGYDAMGRLAGIVHPNESNLTYHATTISFRPLTSADWMPPGIAVGQWRRLEQTGNAIKATYYDGLWRPIAQLEQDAVSPQSTTRYSTTGYDVQGRKAFQSYPYNPHISGYGLTSGTRTFYDDLDRVTRVEQDSELGVLATTTQYLAGLKVRTTNPRGVVTTNTFMAYDQPAYELLVRSDQPEGKVVQIARNYFDKPLWVEQRSADNSVSVRRWYTYTPAMELCKTIEPETGATMMGYDAAGNLAWSAAGVQGAVTDPSQCNATEGYNSGRRSNRSYNNRNRIAALNFPDGRGNQVWSYTPDGLVSTSTVDNDGPGQTPITSAYSYNKRRLLTAEALTQPGWYTWNIGYGYDAYGVLGANVYPDGFQSTYTNNALGQPVQVGSGWGVLASGISYYPNGAMAQFTYGNGIVHTMAQNARQLPGRSIDSGGVLNTAYGYDPNGNVTSAIDETVGAGVYSVRSKWMQYDTLDRLTAAGSGSFGGTDNWHRYTYDALDNLKSWKLPGVKDYANYIYDANNRLVQIKNTAGMLVEDFSYDVQGNLAGKSGRLHQFDYGNRLRGVPTLEGYRYDSQGRRVLAWSPSQGNILSMYSQSGQLLFQQDGRRHLNIPQVYLNGSLLMSLEWNWDTQQGVLKYQHNDALGSPVAITNQSGQVIERTDYEPYGKVIGRQNNDRVGYTGHVMDNATGLTYMQQRYYDPNIGRFLSVDPVTAYEKPMTNFNRYAYALNNPYKFFDPDGRDGRLHWSAPNQVTYTVEYVLTGVKSPVNPAQINAQVAQDFSGTVNINGTNVTVTGQAIQVQQPGPGVNTINVVQNTAGVTQSGRSETNAIGGNHITIGASGPDAATAATVSHELGGHAGGAGDQYKGGLGANNVKLGADVPGPANVMKDLSGQPANSQTLREVIHAPTNVNTCAKGVHAASGGC